MAAHHPRLLDDFPALAQFLDVTKQSAQRGVATRVARAKAKAAHAADATKAATDGTIASES